MPLDPLVSLLAANEVKEVVGAEAPTEYTDMLCNAVSSDFARRIGAPLLQAALDEYYDGTRTRELVLERIPVASVTALFVGAGETVSLEQGPDKDYVFDKKSGIVTLVHGVFPAGPQNVRVQYTAGWSVASVPHDIKYAVKKAIAFLYTERTRIGIQAITTPEQVTQYIDAAYPKGVAETVRHYRRLMVG